jgi:hypothetical protein
MAQVDAAFDIRLNNIAVDRVAEIRMRRTLLQSYSSWIVPSISIGAAFAPLGSHSLVLYPVTRAHIMALMSGVVAGYLWDVKLGTPTETLSRTAQNKSQIHLRVSRCHCADPVQSLWSKDTS